MIAELEATAKIVKSSLQGRLKLRKNQVPRISFMRRDTQLECLLNIVDYEVQQEDKAAHRLESDAEPELEEAMLEMKLEPTISPSTS
jgi:Mn-dependent DtxR family transcriptional regulator